jgi:hypothetical protein
MRVHLRTDAVVVEATDPTLVQLGREVAASLEADYTINGEHPESTSLSSVWRALHDSLDEMRRRVNATQAPGPGAAADDAENATDEEPPAETA